MSSETDADFVARFKAAILEAAKIYEGSWKDPDYALGRGLGSGKYTLTAKESCMMACINQNLPTEMIWVLNELQLGSWSGCQDWAKEK